jgi:L-Lysine epsilon oxidase N-terminal/L-lysine epsilon oxidase C-terminal domain
MRLTTRRDFLRASAAAGALLAMPELAGCGSGSNDQIVRAAIHPALGIARVGNSRESFFFGPEVPGVLPHAARGFKDPQGAVARQAARFRVFGLDRSGRVVRELTAAEARITWQVDVANSKAAWYEFDTAFDIPEAVPAPIRNPAVKGSARSRLAVAPPGRSVSGTGSGPVELSGGSFLGEAVPLGELMTDGAGRLVFLPAEGRAYSPGSTPLGGFAENPGWTDDIADGPVRATVRLGSRTLEADPAWVLVTPPNYAPAMAHGVVTAYDAARSALVDAGMLAPGSVSFAQDILPIFQRLVDLQWVSAGFFEMNGFGSAQDWTADGMPDKLADRSSANAAFRRTVFAGFRSPSFRIRQEHAVPELYGDAGVSHKPASNRQWLAVTPLQYRKLAAWAQGAFSDDRGGTEAATSLDALPLQQRPDALDRAALESCLGGAFHPGIEVSWTLRAASLWSKPFRLKQARTSFELEDHGPKLTRAQVFAPGGPLDGVSPGGLTRWLGLPWHADGASCRSGYIRRISMVLPTFWPARIPTQVLSESDYRIVLDRSRPLAERQAAFERRRDWERFIARPTRPPTLELMVHQWPKLGMVAERPGPGDAAFPKTFKVESYVGFKSEPTHEYGADVWVPQLQSP